LAGSIASAAGTLLDAPVRASLGRSDGGRVYQRLLRDEYRAAEQRSRWHGQQAKARSARSRTESRPLP
jgi:hypothetical protein